MPVLVSDRRIVDDEWVIVETIADYVPSNAIVPYEQLEQTQSTAVWLEGDFEIEEVGEKLSSLDLIAIHFPMFADGRGLSLATLLRTRFHFTGQLRAFGEVQPDLTPFMLRCGFDEFVLKNHTEAETAIKCMAAMTDFYQGSVVEPEPPFRRQSRI